MWRIVVRLCAHWLKESSDIHICILWYQTMLPSTLSVCMDGSLLLKCAAPRKGSQIWTILYSSHQFNTWPSHHEIGTFYVYYVDCVLDKNLSVRSFVCSVIYSYSCFHRVQSLSLFSSFPLYLVPQFYVVSLMFLTYIRSNSKLIGIFL